MTAQNLAVSILSMLSNAKEKKMPIDNAMRKYRISNKWLYLDIICSSHYVILFLFKMNYFLLTSTTYYYAFLTDADAPPGQQQDNWMYHDDKC